MKRHTLLNLAMTALAVFAAAGAFGANDAADAKELTVDQIVEKANFVAYYQGADGRVHVSMNIVDGPDRTRNRELTILRWDAPNPKADEKIAKKDETFTGEQKFYVYFHRPADVNKMAFLVHKHLDRDDDRWLYLPNLDNVKRIAGSEKRTSFAGSDFFYEDISGRHIDEDTHELEQTTKDYYILKNTPKKPDSVEFKYYRTYVHKTTFLVVKNVYYDAKDQAYRQYEAKGVKQIQGYWTVTKGRMTDLLTKEYTDLEYSGTTYDIELPEDIFTERYLRNPPTKWLDK